jgi:hypothetical protein
MASESHRAPQVPTARDLNPEAGHHGIATDPRELRAADAAGERSWRRFPYYALRFGERGERFTRSDSAWLATLPTESEERVCEQAAWLGRVLASRGMPQRLLELHLRVLGEELTLAVPERAAAYAKLVTAADQLAAARSTHVPDELLRDVSREFEEAADEEWVRRLPASGEILVCAVADERQGIWRAVESLAPWFTDAARFPPRWIQAVEATLRRARDLAR